MLKTEDRGGGTKMHFFFALFAFFFAFFSLFFSLGDFRIFARVFLTANSSSFWTRLSPKTKNFVTTPVEMCAFRGSS